MQATPKEIIKNCLDFFYFEHEKEYRFHKTRRWRFDYAVPSYKLAIEIEGGIWIKGRHTRGAGYSKDCEKYNQAAIHGWTVLRYPSNEIKKNHHKIIIDISEFCKNKKIEIKRNIKWIQ